jgi:hypothetical protein
MIKNTAKLFESLEELLLYALISFRNSLTLDN